MIGPLMIICVYLHLFNVLYSSKEKFFILRKLIQKFDAYDLHKNYQIKKILSTCIE